MKRVFEGIANHAMDEEQDFLRVLEWEEKPVDVEFDFCSISDLLPEELCTHKSCASYGEKCWQFGPEVPRNWVRSCIYRDEKGICRPPVFKFKITVEVEPVTLEELRNLGIT